MVYLSVDLYQDWIHFHSRKENTMGETCVKEGDEQEEDIWDIQVKRELWKESMKMHGEGLLK